MGHTTALYKRYPYRFTDIPQPDLRVTSAISPHYQRFLPRLTFRLTTAHLRKIVPTKNILKKNLKQCSLTLEKHLVIKRSKLGFRSRSREPAIKIDGSEPRRHPVNILLLELIKAYIFFITPGAFLKSFFTNLLYI